MEPPEEKDSDPKPAYEAPALEIVPLKGDEVLPGSSKDINDPQDPNQTCRDLFDDTGAAIGS